MPCDKFVIIYQNRGQVGKNESNRLYTYNIGLGEKIKGYGP